MSATRRTALKQFLVGSAALPVALCSQEPIGTLPNLGLKADSGPLRSESGVGALLAWADRLWAVTYVSSAGYKSGSGVGLYEVDDRLSMRQRHVANGCYANRFVHTQSNQAFIGPYAIDLQGNIRVVKDLYNERITATMKHLSDPANRVYMLTMEGQFCEMDVSTLKVNRLHDLLKVFNVQKSHFKGGYTGNGRVVVADNACGVDGYGSGELAEFNGERWNVLSRKPHMEAAGRLDLGDSVFATGWDECSALFHACMNGSWRTYRLPKASRTFDHAITTEWTRIREVETQRFLVDCHGMFFELAPMAHDNAVWGLVPISTHLRVVPDFCTFRGLLVMGGNEGTPSGRDSNPVGGQPQSGLWFGKTDDLWQFGKPKGWGGPWRFTPVKAGQPSDPFLMTGFEHKVLHLFQSGNPSVNFRVEVDFLGTGFWQPYETIRVGADAYRHHEFPPGFSAHWVRITPDANCTATAQFMYT